MKTKIDLNKFVRSLMERYYEKIHIDPTTTKCWLDSVLEDQGLEYKDGEIVEIEQESEGERIKKEILELVSISGNGNQFEEIKDWLEKQASKPKWSEEDERGSDETIELLEYFINYAPEFRKPAIGRSIAWLKSLKPQKPVDWNEEDEHRTEDTIYFLDTAKQHYASTVELDACIDWLKSIKQRIGWKPSKKQMEALHELNLTGDISYAGQAQLLIELYNDLKKLTE